MSKLNITKYDMWMYFKENEFVEGYEHVTDLTIEGLITVENEFLSTNKTLKRISLPSAISIGYKFLDDNEIVEFVNLPKVEKVGFAFLSSNKNLTALSMPNLKETGNWFLSENKILSHLFVPNLKKKGDNFLSSNRIFNSFSDFSPFVFEKNITKEIMSLVQTIYNKINGFNSSMTDIMTRKKRIQDNYGTYEWYYDRDCDYLKTKIVDFGFMQFIELRDLISDLYNSINDIIEFNTRHLDLYFDIDYKEDQDFLERLISSCDALIRVYSIPSTGYDSYMAFEDVLHNIFFLFQTICDKCNHTYFYTMRYLITVFGGEKLQVFLERSKEDVIKSFTNALLLDKDILSYIKNRINGSALVDFNLDELLSLEEDMYNYYFEINKKRFYSFDGSLCYDTYSCTSGSFSEEGEKEKKVNNKDHKHCLKCGSKLDEDNYCFGCYEFQEEVGTKHEDLEYCPKCDSKLDEDNWCCECLEFIGERDEDKEGNEETANDNVDIIKCCAKCNEELDDDGYCNNCYEYRDEECEYYEKQVSKRKRCPVCGEKLDEDYWCDNCLDFFEKDDEKTLNESKDPIEEMFKFLIPDEMRKMDVLKSKKVATKYVLKYKYKGKQKSLDLYDIPFDELVYEGSTYDYDLATNPIFFEFSNNEYCFSDDYRSKNVKKKELENNRKILYLDDSYMDFFLNDDKKAEFEIIEEELEKQKYHIFRDKLGCCPVCGNTRPLKHNDECEHCGWSYSLIAEQFPDYGFSGNEMSLNEYKDEWFKESRGDLSYKIPRDGTYLIPPPWYKEAEKAVKKEQWSYNLWNNEIIIRDYTKPDGWQWGLEVEIPSKIDSSKVVGIGFNSLNIGSDGGSVIIPNTVQFIDWCGIEFAFGTLHVYIPKSVKYIERDALKCSGKIIVYYEGNSLPETWEKLFAVNQFGKKRTEYKFNVSKEEFKKNVVEYEDDDFDLNYN